MTLKRVGIVALLIIGGLIVCVILITIGVATGVLPNTRETRTAEAQIRSASRLTNPVPTQEVVTITLVRSPDGRIGALGPSPIPTETFTPTNTPSSTNTPTITRTPSSTHTASATSTRTASVTSSITLTSTATRTATVTPSITRTPSPTRTPTATRTPSATTTPSPRPTPKPEDVAREAILDVRQIMDEDDIATLIANDRVVTLRYALSDFSASAARHQAEVEFPRFVCALREAGFTQQEFAFTGTIQVVDSFGNEGTAEGVEMILPARTVAAINCDNLSNVDLSEIAERYDVSPLLR